MKEYKLIRMKRMLIGIAVFIVVIIVFGLIFGLRFIVDESQLRVEREDVHFPVVTGNNLDRQVFEFPRDFEGELNLVIIPFLQRQQLDVNTWIPAAQELERSFRGVIYYELPTINNRPALSRTFINEGMRAGIPDQTSRNRTITLYLDKETFKSALDITSENVISLFLIDRQGNILWRDEGVFSEGKLSGLIEVVSELRDN